MRFLWVLVIAGSLTAQADEDGGVSRMFDVKDPVAVTKAQAAVGEAGDGLRELLPASWRSPSTFGLQRWQWLAVPVLAASIVLLTWLLLKLTEAVVRRVRKDQAAAERISERLGGPLKLWWASLLARFSLPLLGFAKETDAAWQHVFRVGLVVAFFWGALRAVSAWSDNFGSSAFAQARPGSRALVSLFSRVVRFALVGFAILAALAEVGYSVTSVLAGLGIGGLALALGAQKTLENVFGAFALAVDQPIREGDFVRIDDFVGTVETIGLRSTRIRTLDRTLISIPNGKLSDMRLETFAARDRVRLLTVVGLEYGTTAAQIKEVIEGFHQALKAHPELWPDSVTVHFAKLGESSLDIEVSAWFITSDFDVFKRIRQEVLLGFMATVEAAGTSIAFPTRTLHLVPPAPLGKEGRGEGPVAMKKPPEHEGSGGR
ncbi:MAG: mechanosensitive ion channel family protein [Archangium sp.]|nr:mechanosensitive ion channel family protein [Archangium sp.]MDP3573196.1 mechanosensitive ion channel family protein [Archangium sp.]